jgi:type II secretory pathway component HofQ
MPRIIARNRTRTSVVQGTVIPPVQDAAPGTPGSSRNLSLSVTPTVLPDNRVELEVDITVEGIGKVVVTTAGMQIPAIDTAQSRGQTLLESGHTLLLDVVEGRPSNGAGTGSERRIVAFVTPTILPGTPPR